MPLVIVALICVFFIYAGDPPPGVNEAHYLVKAKNFWDPNYLANDLFASSKKAHVVFDVLWGWPTRRVSLQTTAWLGRIVGWLILAGGLVRLTNVIFQRAWPALLIAMLWIAGVRYGNLAGEWIVGGIEAKVPAYGLVLFGIAEVLRDRWHRAWVWMGLAASLHVLTGGWSVVATMVAWIVCRFRGHTNAPFFSTELLIGGGISLFGVLPAAMMNMDGSGQSSAASMIYVYDRIPHHLLPADFDLIWYARHSIVIAGCAWLILYRPEKDTRWRLISAILIGVLSIEICGLLLGMLPAIAPEFAASLLRFYWFRLSDALLPLFLAIALVDLVIDVQMRSIRRGAAILATSIGVAAYLYASLDRAGATVPVSVQNRLLGWHTDANDHQVQQTWKDWRAVCRWAEHSTPPGTMFLTPRHQQTFKWYSSRPEVVNWKDVPQDAASLIEWKERMRDVYPASLGHTKVTINYQSLRSMRDRYDAQFMIVDHRVVAEPIPLQKIYPLDPANNQTYAVYDLPFRDSPATDLPATGSSATSPDAAAIQSTMPSSRR